MSFNFPNAPIEGQTYTPVGGYQYVWTDGKWRVVENPQALVKTAETRSRIVNGAMQISQEKGFDTLVAVNEFPADQWQTTWVTSGTPSVFTRTGDAEGGKHLRFGAGSTVDASVAAGDIVSFSTKIEGVRIADFLWGTSLAKQVVLRFTARWVNSPLVISAAIRNGATNRSYVKNVTLTNIFQDYAIVIPGDVTGTWPVDTSLAMVINFTLMGGSTFIGAEGAWQAGNFVAAAGISNIMAVANTTFDLKNVGLYLDPDATGLPPKWAMPDEAQELATCQRYYQKSAAGGVDGTRFSGNVTSGQTYYFTQRFTCTMRTQPAMSGANSGAISFPTAVGSLGANAQGFYESRVANLTQVGLFYCDWVANSRM